MKDKIEKLREWRDKLREFTHDEDCSSRAGCPTKHEKCAKNLNLTTSIAWEVAEWLGFLSKELDRLDEFFSEIRRQEHLQEMELIVTKIICLNEAMISILHRHLLNDSKNRKLYSYLKELKHSLFVVDLEIISKMKI